MKHKTWFRLVLKAIGIVLIGFGLPGLLRNGISMMDVALSGGWTFYSAYGMSGAMADRSVLWMVTLQALPEFIQVAIGLYLLLGGKWLLNRIIPSNRPYCHECGYDLSKNQSVNCPECGIRLPLDSASSDGNPT